MKIIDFLSKRILFLLVGCTSLNAVADDLTVHFPDIHMSGDSICEMVVAYNTNVADLRGFQIEFDLPVGIHLVDAYASEGLQKVCRQLNVTFTDRRNDNKTVVMGFQLSDKNFPTGELDFLMLHFQADSTVIDGTYDVSTSKLLFASNSLGSVEAENQTFHISWTDHVESDSTDFVRWSTYKDANDEMAAKCYKRVGNRLVFLGLTSDDNACAYSLDGMRVPVSLSPCDEGMALLLDDMPQGVFVLRINGKSFKVVRP